MGDRRDDVEAAYDSTLDEDVDSDRFADICDEAIAAGWSPQQTAQTKK